MIARKIAEQQTGHQLPNSGMQAVHRIGHIQHLAEDCLPEGDHDLLEALYIDV
jgi:hypothetical protein